MRVLTILHDADVLSPEDCRETCLAPTQQRAQQLELGLDVQSCGDKTETSTVEWRPRGVELERAGCRAVKVHHGQATVRLRMRHSLRKGVAGIQSFVRLYMRIVHGCYRTWDWS